QIAFVRATGTLFDVLRVRPALGRPLTPDDERKEAPNVVVMTDTLWRQRFGGDPGILGRSIAVDARPYTVVGVLPPGFQLPQPIVLGGGVLLIAKGDGFAALRGDGDGGWVGDFNNAALGRLEAGVPAERARADLDVLQARVTEIVNARAHEPVTMRAAV